jgi:Ribbon-helix-helix protein, copG family
VASGAWLFAVRRVMRLKHLGGMMAKDRLFTVRLDEETYAKLEKIAKDDERNIAYVVRKAIEQFIKRGKQ